MLRLRTFGAAFVERDGDVLRGAAAQRRVVALLAVLAVARDEGVSRDRLVGLLWPESEPEKARQALAQAIYHTRRAVAEEQLFVATADLRLNRDIITSDVAEFEQALEADDLDRAVSLYAGPFLEGFYVGGTSEFERWASEQRKRLADLCAVALERLASAAETGADYHLAVRWRKRRAALDPLNSRVAMDLMVAMAAAGDPAGAIQHARVHELLLRQELDVAPDAGLTELVRQLRTGPPPTSSRVQPSPVGTNGEKTAQEPPSSIVRGPPPRSAAAGDPSGVAPAGRPPFSRIPRRVVAVASMVVLISVAAVLWGSRSSRASRAEAPTVPGMVVVAPFRVAGADPSLGYLHEGLVDLLVTKLTDDQAGLAADPASVVSGWRRARLLGNADAPRAEALRIARELGADRLITGSVVGTASRVVISASLVTVPSGQLRAQATVEGGVDSLNALVDRLAIGLLAKEAGAWDRLASRTSTSLPALRAFLDGQSAYRRGGYRNAVQHFGRALELDSTFAMAALGLAQSAERIGLGAQRSRGLAAAWQARGELTERDRVYLDALAGPRYPAPPSEREQLAGWERAAAATPSRADVWHELGERFFYDGQLLGVRNWYERAVGAFERAAELDGEFASPLQYLAQLAAHAGDTTDVRRLTSRYLQLDSAGDLSDFVRWRSAVAVDDRRSLTQLRRQFTAMPAVTLQLIAISAQFHLIEGEDAERAFAVLLGRAVRGAERVELHLGRHALALNRGRPSAAVEIAEEIEELQPLSTDAARLRVLDGLYGWGDSAVAARSIRRLDRVTDGAQSSRLGPDRLEDVCVAAQWRAWHDDVSALGEAMRVLTNGSHDWPSAAVCAALIDAIAATRQRRPDARARAQRLDSLVMFGPTLGDMRSYVNLAAARVHESQGDRTRALAAIRRRPHMQRWGEYLAPALYDEGRLAAMTGDSAAAARAYRHFLSLQQDPEPSAAPMVARARSELARLDRT